MQVGIVFFRFLGPGRPLVVKAHQLKAVFYITLLPVKGAEYSK